MRIAMVCPYGLARPGGVQQQALGLSGALARAGASVALFAPDADAVVADGFEAVTLGAARAIVANGSRAPIAPFPSTFARTLGALSRFQADVVHVHEPLVPGPSLAALAARGRIIATFHRAGAGRFAPALAPFTASLSWRISAPVAVSELARRTALSYFPIGLGHVSILHNGVDTARFSGRARPSRGRPSVVFVGRHERRKGLAVLLRAFSSLELDASLVVLSDGPQSERLRAEAAGDERISFLGQVSDDELAIEVASADVLVAPALGGESFGVVLVEAMAARTAVIASSIPGYLEAAGDAACFVPPGDDVALKGALRSLLVDAAAREALVERGAARAAKLAFEELAKRYLALYDEVLASGRVGLGAS